MDIKCIGPVTGTPSKPSQEPIPEFSTHVLRLKGGVKVTMTFNNENAQFTCAWEPPPPIPKGRLKKIMPHYLKWRDSIMEAYTARTGRRVMIISA